MHKTRECDWLSAENIPTCCSRAYGWLRAEYNPTNQPNLVLSCVDQSLFTQHQKTNPSIFQNKSLRLLATLSTMATSDQPGACVMQSANDWLEAEN